MEKNRLLDRRHNVEETAPNTPLFALIVRPQTVSNDFARLGPANANEVEKVSSWHSLDAEKDECAHLRHFRIANNVDFLLSDGQSLQRMVILLWLAGKA